MATIEANIPALRRTRRSAADTGFRWASLSAAMLVLVILVLIAYYTTREAVPAFRAEGLGFLTNSRWAPNEGVFGALSFIYGTILVSLVALVLAVPASIGIALFVTEYSPPWLRRPTTFVIDLLAAVPSVVFGLWALNVLVVKTPAFYNKVGSSLGSVPGLSAFFGGAPNGKSFVTAGFVLALMVTPIITSITREVFDTTPAGQKEAAWALGCTRWEVIRGAIMPHSKAGIVGAVLLGLGRAMGETIAAALTIGSGTQITTHLFASGDSMAARIANEFGEATNVWRSGLVGLGVVLFGMTIVVNLIARLFVSRAERSA